MALHAINYRLPHRLSFCIELLKRTKRISHCSAWLLGLFLLLKLPKQTNRISILVANLTVITRSSQMIGRESLFDGQSNSEWKNLRTAKHLKRHHPQQMIIGRTPYDSGRPNSLELLRTKSNLDSPNENLLGRENCKAAARKVFGRWAVPFGQTHHGYKFQSRARKVVPMIQMIRSTSWGRFRYFPMAISN